MERKHRNEMIRFAESEIGTAVWFKYKTMKEWEKSYTPTWSNDTIYIVDDKYAKLRKESIDTGRKIQVKDSVTGKWSTLIELSGLFPLPLENYRLEPEEFKYPVYKKDKDSSLVVKFTGLKDGVVIEGTPIYSVGYRADDWYPHTDTNEWEDINFIEPIYYYQWEKRYDDGIIAKTDWLTDACARSRNYEKQGWRKIENSKRTWE